MNVFLDIALALSNRNINLITIATTVVFAGIVAIITNGRNKEFNDKILNILAILIIVIYQIDVFTPILIGRISLNRLPFTIGSIMGPLIIVTRFIPPFDKIKPTVCVFAVISMFVYMLYPDPKLYYDLKIENIRNIITSLYFSLLYCYGIVSLVSHDVELNIKRSYLELIGLIAIETWSFLVKAMINSTNGDGSMAVSDTYTTIDILKLSPIIILISFLMCLIVHLLDILIRRIDEHKKKRLI